MISRHALVVLAFVAVAAPAMAAETAIPSESASALRICVDPDHPPLSLNRAGAQPGIDVAIGLAIAARLDLRPRLVWVDTTYGGRAVRRSLLAGQCDLFMGLPVDPVADTAGAMALTAPYYSTGYRLVRARDSSNKAGTTIDLHQLRIAVERQSDAQMRLDRTGSYLIAYANQREVLDAVAHGEADAGAVGLSDVDRLLQGSALVTNAPANAAPKRPLRWNMAIGVRRADVNLRSSVDRVIGDLLADGRIEVIFNRYGLPFFPPITDY